MVAVRSVLATVSVVGATGSVDVLVAVSVAETEVSVVDATVASVATASELADEAVDEATVAIVVSDEATVSSACAT